MYRSIAVSKSCVLVKLPRLSCRVVSSENQHSIRFNHDPLVGVKCSWKRGYPRSQS